MPKEEMRRALPLKGRQKGPDIGSETWSPDAEELSSRPL